MNQLKEKLQLPYSLLFTFLVGFSLLGTNTLTQFPSLRIKNFQVFPYKYSISIINTSKYSNIYKISPYKDKIAFRDGSQREIIAEQENLANTESDKLNNWFYRIYQNLLQIANKTSVKFSTKGDFTVNYKIEKLKDAIAIKRNIGKINKEPQELAKAFLYSKNDLVFDSQGKIYINPLPEDQYAALTLANNVKDLETKNNSLCYVVVLDPNTSGAILIPIEKTETLAVSEKEKNIQIKEPIRRNPKTIESAQKIYFFENIDNIFSYKLSACD